MAVYSMTGYASAQRSADSPSSPPSTSAGGQARISLEIRSVNSRFLDVSFRLSEELRGFEPQLRERLGQHQAFA